MPSVRPTDDGCAHRKSGPRHGGSIKAADG